MPLTFTRSFRVRHYECDPYGHVNNATYLRYMQEAAFDASAAAGYDFEKYRDLGTLWLIRETGIEYLRPAAYDQTLAVRTWVADFRRIRSRREYEMSVNGDIVARAFTDWVYLDAATQQPARIPDELIAGFFPEGAPPTAPRREPFPEPPPIPPGAFTAQRRVQWHELDGAGHVNNAMYVSYLEDTAIQAAESVNWGLGRVAERNIAILAREHRLEYLRPAVLGDELAITTWLSNFRRTNVVRHYAVKRAADGELLLRARTLWVWVDLKTGRPTPIPVEMLADFEGQTAEG